MHDGPGVGDRRPSRAKSTDAERHAWGGSVRYVGWKRPRLGEHEPSRERDNRCVWLHGLRVGHVRLQLRRTFRVDRVVPDQLPVFLRHHGVSDLRLDRSHCRPVHRIGQRQGQRRQRRRRCQSDNYSGHHAATRDGGDFARSEQWRDLVQPDAQRHAQRDRCRRFGRSPDPVQDRRGCRLDDLLGSGGCYSRRWHPHGLLSGDGQRG